MRFDAHRLLPKALALLSLALAQACVAMSSEEAGALLRRADESKAANQSEFAGILQSLQDEVQDLTPAQRQYLRYLQGWRSAYSGDYEAAIPLLKSVVDEAQDTTLQFRAGVTAANVAVLAGHYQDAFTRLGQLLTLLPEVRDEAAREQGHAVAAYLYTQVGEFDLALGYADRLIQENWAGRGACRGGQLRLEALYKAGRLREVGPELQQGADACVAAGDPLRASAIHTYAARLHMDRGRFHDAIRLLTRHYPQVLQSAYPRMISEYDSLLARAHRGEGSDALARDYALRALEHGVKNQYTEPLVTANRLLYELALERGEVRAALNYHEQYAAADKGYLDDVSARQLAYERVSHAAIASQLQIDALNKQNQVLQLEQALGRQAAQTSRLYIALLLTVIAFVLLWAYRTKRSQLHFMKLSRIDGLTGIANRPHFIAQAERMLETCRRSRQEVCVLLWDLDHFKAVNDKYGHATGDFVLKQAVAACQAHLREGEPFGRFGGEEFGLLLPSCSLAQARQRAEQLRLAIAAVAAHPGSLVGNVSASFGIASSVSSGYELRQLLAHADGALYRAKHGGRNQVVLYETMRASDCFEGEGSGILPRPSSEQPERKATR